MSALTNARLLFQIASRLAGNGIFDVRAPKDYADVMRDIVDSAAQSLVSSADVTYNLNTTLADIPGFVFTLAPNTGYGFEFNFPIVSGVAGGLKFALAGTTDSVKLSAEYILFSSNGVAAGAVTTLAGGGITAAVVGLHVNGGIITGPTGGTFKIQAAQNASNAANTTLYAGSIFRLQPGATPVP